MVLASAQTFVVHPSGGDDTAHIQAAFNAAVKAGPGSVVQLSAGTFHTNAIWVKGFNGTVRGAGEGATVIDTPRALDPSVPGVNSDPAATHETQSFLVGFSGGSVTVSDMSIDISAAQPADPRTADESVDQTTIDDDFIVTDSASAAFDRVGFLAGVQSDGSPNVVGGIAFEGHVTWDENSADATYGYPLHVAPSGDCDSVRDCSVASLDVGVATAGLTNGSLTVGGCAAAQNTIAGTSFGCVLLDDSNSGIVVSHNQISVGFAGIWCQQGYVAFDSDLPNQLPPFPAPRYQIADNRITTPSLGLTLYNVCAYYGMAPRLDATVSGNRIVLTGSSGDGQEGIGEYATHDILCTHNTISGIANWGIYVGDDADVNNNTLPVYGWRILGNDLTGLTTTVAPIDLGTGTTHNLVCPTPAGTIDNGVDNWLLDPLPASASGSVHAATARPLASPNKLRLLKEMRRL